MDTITDMPGGYKLELTGLSEVLNKIDVRQFEEDVTLELDAFGKDVARDAKDNLSKNKTNDEGYLTNSIGSESEKLSVSIFANADYAAYVEFGTRKFAAAYVASLPAEWKVFAAQFKGSGGSGSFEEFVMRLAGWCKRKGVDEKAAYAIARSILINGIKAQPYLFPAFEKNRSLLIKNLQNLFK